MGCWDFVRVELAIGRAFPWRWRVKLPPGGGVQDACAMGYGVHCANDEPYGFRVGDEFLPPGPLKWPPPNPWLGN